MTYWLHCQTCKKWTKSITPLSKDKLCFYCNKPLVKPKQVFSAKIENVAYDKSSKFEKGPKNTIENQQDIYIETPPETEIIQGKNKKGIDGIEESKSNAFGLEELGALKLDISESRINEMSKLDANEPAVLESHDLDISKSKITEPSKLDTTNSEKLETLEFDTTKSEGTEVFELDTTNYEEPEENSLGISEPSTMETISPKSLNRQLEPKKPVEKKPLIKKEIPNPPLKYMLIDEVIIKGAPAHKINIKN